MQQTGSYILLNDKILPAKDFNADIPGFDSAIYEVLRVIEGKPLFLEDHLERLQNSARLLQMNLSPDFIKVSRNLVKLSGANNITDGNIRIAFIKGEPGIFLAYFIPHFYPDSRHYLLGYTLKTLETERPNPNVKATNTKLAEHVAKIKTNKNVDEILWVNHDGIITEGSKSNIFFVRDEQLFTAPRDLVLPGITREKVFEICKKNNIPCFEKMLFLQDLPSVDGAFITGTSPKIMAVRAIDDLKLDVGIPVIKRLMGLYDNMISAYLKNFNIQ